MVAARAAVLAVVLAAAALALASAPHCAAMCGPLCSYVGGTERRGRVRYQVGRTIGYVAAGAVVGAFGQAIAQPLSQPWWRAAVAWSAAAVLIAAAIASWPRRREQLLKLGRKRGGLFARFSSVVKARPLAIGCGTTLLPCGALWAALVVAASSASPISGAVAMAVFATISGAVLLSSGWLLGRLGRRLSGRRSWSALLAVAAVLLIALPVPALVSPPSGDAPAACPLHAGSAP